jgi:hypothetical protein
MHIKYFLRGLTGLTGLMDSVLSPFTFSTLPNTNVLYRAQAFVQNNLLCFWLSFILIAIIIEYIILFLENRKLTKSNAEDKNKLEEEIAELKKKLEKYNKPTSINYKRFEEIKDKGKIEYGYIDYAPYFSFHEGQKAGIGYAILLEAVKPLKINLIKEGEESASWDTILSKLEDRNHYDVVAIPLYETRTRLYDYNIAYCIPLFYSQIGLYVHKDDFENIFSGKKLHIVFLRRILINGRPHI